jgi:ABC-type nickel/cobalt efflux system permease component RcnA
MMITMAMFFRFSSLLLLWEGGRVELYIAEIGTEHCFLLERMCVNTRCKSTQDKNKAIKKSTYTHTHTHIHKYNKACHREKTAITQRKGGNNR